MRKCNLILTGFMGTGKTTTGKMLAARLDYEFIDTDHLIEIRQGRTVAEIFEQSGEHAFREMEAALARDLSEKEGLVIATGGRMMLDAGNAAVLEKNGQVFCLTAAADEIFGRVCADSTVRRPLLETPDPAARIKSLMKAREQGYSRFHQVATSGKTPEAVCCEILREFENPGSTV